MALVKNPRFLILLCLTLISICLLSSSLLMKKGGVIVTSLSPDSKCSNVEEGFIIFEISGRKILSLDDFENEVKKLKADEYVTMIANNMPAGCFATKDGDIGVEIKEIARKGLIFSSEISDSRVDVFEIKNLSGERLKEVTEILKIRSNKLKLFQTEVSLSDSLIKITNPQELQDLFAECEFEIKISHKFDVKNGSAFIDIGDNSYELKFYNESFEINNTSYDFNQSFYLEGIKFELLNITNTSAVFHATVVSNKDVKNLLSQYAPIRFDATSQSYILNFPLEISTKAEVNIKNILKNIGAFFIGEQVFLQADFQYFLDDKFISSFPVPRDYRREASTISIIVFEKSLDEANKLNRLLDACLSSGVFKYGVEKVATEVQKARFTTLAKILVLIIVAMVFIPVVKFYRRIKNSFLPSVLLTFEITIIFGIAALTQLVFSPGWIIDLATLFGLVGIVSISSWEFLFKIKKLEIGKYLFWTLGFILLFTPLKGFGLVVIFWAIIHEFLIKPLLKDFYRF